MGILWPGFLLLLALIPLLIGVYLLILRRRRRFAVRYSSLSLVRAAQPGSARLRRHLPFALFLLAISSLVVSAARPVARVEVPSGQVAILLAIDVSLSMCSTDIQPNRLEAAKQAAQSFVERQSPGTQIGIVAFAGYAELIQPPTTDQESLQAAIDNLTTGRRTAIGSGILESLDAIAEIDPNVAPSDSRLGSGITPEPVPQGTFVPDIIVVLTDGVSNSGPEPLEAAQQAAERGVRIYTIGFGTANENTRMQNCSRQSWGGSFNDPFFGGGQFGGRFRRGIDEATLTEVADLTGGTYYAASSADELHEVFQSLPTYLTLRTETTEISFAFAAAGALLAALAVSLSLLWRPLP